MMADLSVSINAVMQVEEKGYINVARGEYCGEDNGGWRTPDDSSIEMEGEEEEGTEEMFYVNVLTREKEKEGEREVAKESVRERSPDSSGKEVEIGEEGAL
jgi:hypothetical protein